MFEAVAHQMRQHIPEFASISSKEIREKVADALEAAIERKSGSGTFIDLKVLENLTYEDVNAIRRDGEWKGSAFNLGLRLIHKLFHCNIRIYSSSEGKYLENESKSCFDENGNPCLRVVWNEKDHFDSTIPSEKEERFRSMMAQFLNNMRRKSRTAKAISTCKATKFRTLYEAYEQSQITKKIRIKKNVWSHIAECYANNTNSRVKPSTLKSRFNKYIKPILESIREHYVSSLQV